MSRKIINGKSCILITEKTRNIATGHEGRTLYWWSHNGKFVQTATKAEEEREKGAKTFEAYSPSQVEQALEAEAGKKEVQETDRGT